MVQLANYISKENMCLVLLTPDERSLALFLRIVDKGTLYWIINKKVRLCQHFFTNSNGNRFFYNCKLPWSQIVVYSEFYQVDIVSMALFQPISGHVQCYLEPGITQNISFSYNGDSSPTLPCINLARAASDHFKQHLATSHAQLSSRLVLLQFYTICTSFSFDKQFTIFEHFV